MLVATLARNTTVAKNKNSSKNTATEEQPFALECRASLGRSLDVVRFQEIRLQAEVFEFGICILKKKARSRFLSELTLHPDVKCLSPVTVFFELYFSVVAYSFASIVIITLCIDTVPTQTMDLFPVSVQLCLKDISEMSFSRTALSPCQKMLHWQDC